MGLPEISTTPKKDWMEMDYLPVYDTPPAETGGKGKILCYRNPMGQRLPV
jgi:hypothetical protein